jgi:hypothetical protein
LIYEVDDLKEKAFRLGITVRDDVTTQTFSRELKKYVSRLFEVVGEKTLVRSLLDSRPRLYLTTTPMYPKALHKLALWGRRFEIQQLWSMWINVIAVALPCLTRHSASEKRF